MRDDLLYTCSPRWLEESGLPEEIVERVGEAGWSVLKKLFELETEQNFFPDWFLVSREDLHRWTGALSDRIDEVIKCLEQEGYLERKEGVTPGGLEHFRFLEPLLTEEEAERTRERLKARGYTGVTHLTLRYVDAMPAKDKFRTVRQLYEQVFGLRMNTRIADDLREITERFDLALILSAFEEMRRKPNKSLAGLITALYRGERHADTHQADR
ncbi:MAG TPA: hypothetical protein PKH07_03065 [bacterium]|nr:hypothetical protein [bacterium]